MIEAGPLAESICVAVEGVGASIEIIDSRHTKALLHGNKKTDRIDAHVLSELACMGWYKPVYRRSGNVRQQRSLLKGRAALVKVSTDLKNAIRGLLRAHGIVLPARSQGAKFVAAVTEAIQVLPAELQRVFGDLLAVWSDANNRQKSGYRELVKIAQKDDLARRFMTVPGVGPATALGFAATIATHTRFKDAKHVVGYLGLAPRVHQSGDTNFHGRITKNGDSMMRWLLVEAANAILTLVKEPFALREWGLKLAERKGFAKAKVAVARRLAELLFTLWRDERDFEPRLVA